MKIKRSFIQATRAGSTPSGNPRWIINLQADGFVQLCPTNPDANIAHEVSNFRFGDQVEVTLDSRGRIQYMKKI